MKKTILILFFSPLFVGCTQFKKLTSAESRPPQVAAQADITVLEGGPLQGAKEVVMLNGLQVNALTVEVKKPGATTFRQLNKYEFKKYGDYIQFGPTATIHEDGRIGINHGIPSAPAGSFYRVTVYKTDSSKELY